MTLHSLQRGPLALPHLHHPIPLVCVIYSRIPYSGKFSLGANFRDFRGQTCFRKNKNREKMEIDDVITCVRRVPM